MMVRGENRVGQRGRASVVSCGSDLQVLEQQGRQMGGVNSRYSMKWRESVSETLSPSYSSGLFLLSLETPFKIASGLPSTQGILHDGYFCLQNCLCYAMKSMADYC